MTSQSTDKLVKRFAVEQRSRTQGVDSWAIVERADGHLCLYEDYERLQRELADRDKTIETLREDAERYRWLRYRTGSLEVVGLIEKRGVRLDEAIDAARSEGGNHE